MWHSFEIFKLLFIIDPLQFLHKPFLTMFPLLTVYDFINLNLLQIIDSLRGFVVPRVKKDNI